ncbi:MAG: hypothetical protein ABSD62_15180 [Candidatus Limnocylindrales bacterium]
MSVKATAAGAAQAWSAGFAAAGTKYAAGINAVTVAPGQLAAAQKNAYLAGVQANAGIWAAKVAAVSLPDWKTASTTTGSQRLGSGATKGAPKYQAFATAFIPQLTSIVGSLPARGTYDQNIARFTSYAQALHALKGNF